MLRFFLIAFYLTAGSSGLAQSDKKSRWVDSVFSTLRIDEKIGQMMMAVMPTADEIILKEPIKAGKIGGLLLAHSSPMRHAKGINKMQVQSKIPLLVAADLSIGLPQLFDSVMTFYNANTLSAVANDSLHKALPTELERQQHLLGINLNLIPNKNSVNGLLWVDVRQTVAKPKEKKGNAEKQLFLMGYDLLIAPKNSDAAIKQISKTLRKNRELSGQLERSVKKILALKYESGLAQNKFIDTDNIVSKLHTPSARLLKQQLAEAAVTLVQNNSGVLPIQKLDGQNFVSVSVGEESKNVFTHYLSKYADFQHLSLKTLNDTTGLEAKVRDKDVIVVGFFPGSSSWTKDVAEQIKKISVSHRMIVCSFQEPQTLAYFENIPAVIAAYSDEEEIQKTTAEIIFGAIPAKGVLPVSVSRLFYEGKSESIKVINRLAYALPEAVGMDSKTLERVETIAQEAIAIGATPGCHLLVAKDGKVVYEKSFGTLTYDKKTLVTEETIYDLASITKVAATLQAVMYLHEKGLIDIHKKASVYLPELKNTNKENFILKDILTHQAGLWPFLPFWAETVKDSSAIKKYYRSNFSEEFPHPVAEKLFATKAMKDSLWQWIIKSKVREKPARMVYEYRYSDMGFYILQHVVEKILGQPMEEFLQQNIYQPMGASTMGYLPLRKFPSSQIAPTENDTLFRRSLLMGYVHDQGAAMHGGVAGHAGLFSNANDLAKLGQLGLNKGSYGGIQIFKPETIDFFTEKQYESSRRGLGWDKPIVNDPNSPTSMFASAKTFGHTGFTGTSIWVDSEFNLVFVFLSNRVNPDMNNTKILAANIRPRIQEVIYQSIFEYCKNRQ